MAKALEDAEQCIALNPTWEKAYFRKAAVFEAQGEHEKASTARVVQPLATHVHYAVQAMLGPGSECWPWQQGPSTICADTLTLARGAV
jgi:hypothetical protein